MPASSPFTGAEVRLLQVDAVDLMVEVPGVPRRRPGDQHEDQGQVPPDPGRRALAGATFRGSMRRAVSSIVLFGALALAASASAGAGRLVDLASELVEALLDRVLRPDLPPRARRRRSPADLLTELVKALLDGIVLGIGRTHRASVQIEDVRPDAPADARAPEVAPAWAAGTRRAA